MALSETPDRADPITRQIASRVVELRKRRGWNQDDLATRMLKLRKGWSRSTVVKFEGFKRKDLSVADLMALAIVLNVPPTMLIADPNQDEPVPMGDDGRDRPSWDVLLWMLGRKEIRFEDVDAAPYERYKNNFDILWAGWEISEATFALSTPAATTYLGYGAKEVAEMAEEDEKKKDVAAIRRLDYALNILEQRGIPAPPLSPRILKRADELDMREYLAPSGS